MTAQANGAGVGDTSPWPIYRLDEHTAGLLASVLPVLEGTEVEAEEERYLPRSAVDALLSAGFFKMSLPREVGGWEADVLLEMEVFEAVARVSTVACWNLVVGNFHSSLPAAFCSDDAVKEMFLSDATPVVAGQPVALGKGRDVPGGMVVTGRHSWGSGIAHSDWVIGGCTVEGAEPQQRVWVAPKSEVTIFDNWFVFGLSGTGSTDFAVEDHFVPDGWWFPLASSGPITNEASLGVVQAKRGGNKYHAPVRVWPLSGHVGLVLGGAERAIKEIAMLASRKRRRNSSTSVAEREMFRQDLAKAFITVSGMRDLAARLFATLSETTAAGEPVPLDLVLDLYGMSAQATRTASAVAVMAHGYAGGDSVRLDNPIQRVIRDLLVAQQHIIYSDTHIGRLGEALIDRFAD